MPTQQQYFTWQLQRIAQGLSAEDTNAWNQYARQRFGSTFIQPDQSGTALAAPPPGLAPAASSPAPVQPPRAAATADTTHSPQPAGYYDTYDDPDNAATMKTDNPSHPGFIWTPGAGKLHVTGFWDRADGNPVVAGEGPSQSQYGDPSWGPGYSKIVRDPLFSQAVQAIDGIFELDKGNWEKWNHQDPNNTQGSFRPWYGGANNPPHADPRAADPAYRVGDFLRSQYVWNGRGGTLNPNGIGDPVEYLYHAGLWQRPTSGPHSQPPQGQGPDHAPQSLHDFQGDGHVANFIWSNRANTAWVNDHPQEAAQLLEPLRGVRGTNFNADGTGNHLDLDQWFAQHPAPTSPGLTNTTQALGGLGTPPSEPEPPSAPAAPSGANHFAHPEQFPGWTDNGDGTATGPNGELHNIDDHGIPEAAAIGGQQPPAATGGGSAPLGTAGIGAAIPPNLGAPATPGGTNPQVPDPTAQYQTAYLGYLDDLLKKVQIPAQQANEIYQRAVIGLQQQGIDFNTRVFEQSTIPQMLHQFGLEDKTLAFQQESTRANLTGTFSDGTQTLALRQFFAQQQNIAGKTASGDLTQSYQEFLANQLNIGGKTLSGDLTLPYQQFLGQQANIGGRTVTGAPTMEYLNAAFQQALAGRQFDLQQAATLAGLGLNERQMGINADLQERQMAGQLGLSERQAMGQLGLGEREYLGNLGLQERTQLGQLALQRAQMQAQLLSNPQSFLAAASFYGGTRHPENPLQGVDTFSQTNYQPGQQNPITNMQYQPTSDNWIAKPQLQPGQGPVTTLRYGDPSNPLTGLRYQPGQSWQNPAPGGGISAPAPTVGAVPGAGPLDWAQQWAAGRPKTPYGMS